MSERQPRHRKVVSFTISPKASDALDQAADALKCSRSVALELLVMSASLKQVRSLRDAAVRMTVENERRRVVSRRGKTR